MRDPDAIVDFLLDADEDQRSEWATGQPAEPNWWLALLVAVEHCRSEADAEISRVIGLHLWLLRVAAEVRAFTADEGAIRTALLVAQLRLAGHSANSVEGLPSADAVTAQCLDLLPSSPDHLPDRDELLHRLATRDEHALDEARLSRRAKNLVTAAARHAGHLSSTQLQAQLQRWIDALPRLM